MADITGTLIQLENNDYTANGVVTIKDTTQDSYTVVRSGEDKYNSNLFDKSLDSTLEGYIYVYGGEMRYDDDARTLYIPCEPNTTYLIRKGYWDGGNKYFVVASCDTIPNTSSKVSNGITYTNENIRAISYTTSSTATYLLVTYYRRYTYDPVPTEDEARNSVFITKVDSKTGFYYVPNETPTKIPLLNGYNQIFVLDIPTPLEYDKLSGKSFVTFENDNYYADSLVEIVDKDYYNIAPLKGYTASQLFSSPKFELNDGIITQNFDELWAIYTYNLGRYEKGKRYTLVVDVYENTLNNKGLQIDGDTSFGGIVGVQLKNDVYFKDGYTGRYTFGFNANRIQGDTNISSVVRFMANDSTSGHVKYSFAILEGDYENKPIPKDYEHYSVTRSGKNLAPLDKPASDLFTGSFAGTLSNEKITLTGNGVSQKDAFYTYNLGSYKPSTKYTLVLNITKNTLAGNSYIVYKYDTDNVFNNSILFPKTTGTYKYTLTTFDDITNSQYVTRARLANTEAGSITYSFMILMGDYTNEDTPYEEAHVDTYQVPLNTPYRLPILNGYNQLFADQNVPLNVDYKSLGQNIIQMNNGYGTYGTVEIKGKPFTNLAPLDKPASDLFASFNGQLNNGLITITGDGTNYSNALYNYNLNVYKPGTNYTLVLNITANTLISPYNVITSNYASTGIFSNSLSFPQTTGTFKYLLTTRDSFENYKYVLRTVLALAETGSITYSFAILEGDYTNQPIPENYETFAVTRSGKNLFDFDKVFNSETAVYNGTIKVDNSNRTVDITASADSCYTQTGVITSGTLPNSYKKYAIEVKPNTTYTLKIDREAINGSLGIDVGVYTLLDGDYGYELYSGFSNNKTFTTTSNTKYICIRLDNAGRTGGTVRFSNIQLEIGEQATEYVPYIKPKVYNVPLNSPTRFKFNVMKDTLLYNEMNAPMVLTDYKYTPAKVWLPTDYINIEDYYRITTNLCFAAGKTYWYNPNANTGVYFDEPETLTPNSIPSSFTWNDLEWNIDDVMDRYYSQQAGIWKPRQEFRFGGKYIDYNELNAIESTIESLYNRYVK